MKKILIAITLMLTIGLTGCSAEDNTPKGVVEAYYNAILDRDLDKAMTYLDKGSWVYPPTAVLRRGQKQIDTRMREVTGEENRFFGGGNYQ